MDQKNEKRPLQIHWVRGKYTAEKEAQKYRRPNNKRVETSKKIFLQKLKLKVILTIKIDAKLSGAPFGHHCII